jgi:pimeloyl-ACP methyl ester carboxylesterase
MPTVETNGIQTYYEEYGEGMPVVCLHGATSDHQLFAEQFKPLDNDTKIIVYDLRGHGRTEGSDEKSYSMSLYAEDLAALIKEIGLNNPVICGLSLGGAIGYKFAATRPEQLSGLITLGAPTAQTVSTREWLIRVALARAMAPILGNEKVISTIVSLFNKLSNENSTVDLDDMGKIRNNHNCDNTEMSTTDTAKITRGSADYMGSSTRIDWSSVDIPVLAMYGENEPFTEQHVSYVRNKVDDCRTEEVPDASHNSHVDNPEFIIKQTRKFLSKISNGRVSVDTK